MKIFGHALNVSVYVAAGLLFVCAWLIRAVADWAELRLERMAFGDGPTTCKEWVEAILCLIVCGLIVHFYF